MRGRNRDHIALHFQFTEASSPRKIRSEIHCHSGIASFIRRIRCKLMPTPSGPPAGTSLWDRAVRNHPVPHPLGPSDVPRAVDSMLAGAREAGASDVHLVPADAGLRMLWRIDSVLHEVAVFPREVRSNIVARLKVLADLLTYQSDVPQEGRIAAAKGDIEIRVSTFPTLFGEKAVVRLFAGSNQLKMLGELGLPEDVRTTLQSLLAERGGVVLATGPAGSGKTTTAYACLREIAAQREAPRSVVTLEDPVESVVEGTAQSQIRQAAGFTYESGMRSLLRQDPDVILVGEIRDPATAQSVFQAALTGHLILSTFHAGSAAETVSRLFDMGIEGYQLRSALRGVLNQRLLRRLCRCAIPAATTDEFLGLDVTQAFLPSGCADCHGTGYRGRFLITELLVPETSGEGSMLSGSASAAEIERRSVEAGLRTRWSHANEAVTEGRTSPAEVRRAFGFRSPPKPSSK